MPFVDPDQASGLSHTPVFGHVLQDGLDFVMWQLGIGEGCLLEFREAVFRMVENQDIPLALLTLSFALGILATERVRSSVADLVHRRLMRLGNSNPGHRVYITDEFMHFGQNTTVAFNGSEVTISGSSVGDSSLPTLAAP